MDAVLQHPALVVVRAQPELALLVGVHGAVSHAEAPVGCHVPTPLKSPLVPCPSQLVLAFVDTLGGHLGLPAGLVLDVVALAAKGNGSGALLLQLEQAWLAVAPLVPSQPGLLVSLELGLVPRLDCVLELVVRQGEVHAVRVHLDEFEVSPVQVEVEELVVELEHAKLRQLVNHDAYLAGAGAMVSLSLRSSILYASPISSRSLNQAERRCLSTSSSLRVYKVLFCRSTASMNFP